MSDTTLRTQQKARRHLATVSPSEVEAMQALDADTLSALVTYVRAITQDDDTREHATIIAASFYLGASGEGAARTRHAARAAVRAAQRSLALSRHLDGWDLYGDMTEDVMTTVEDATVRTGLPRYAPDPQASPMVATSLSDLLATVITSTGSEDLRHAALAYLRHARHCAECTEASEQRVTLQGVRSHVAGRTGSDSAYHSERRAVLRALANVPGHGVVSDALGYDASLGYAPEATDPKGEAHGRTGEAWTALARRIGDAAPLAPAHVPHASVSLGDCAPVSTRAYLAPVRTVMTEATRTQETRTVVTQRATHAPTQRDPWDLATRRAARAYDAAMRAEHSHTRRTLRALGIRTGAHRTVALDSLGYDALLGYAPRVADVEGTWRALLAAERAAVRHGEDVTRTESRTVTTTRTEYAAPRSLSTQESSAHPAPEVMARHAGEEYRGGTHGHASGQADAFGHAPRAEANTGRATTPGDQVRTGAVSPSPRKRPRTGSTGPTVTAW